MQADHPGSAPDSYAQAFAREVTGIAGLECPPDLRALVWQRLSRDEERAGGVRDALGRWEPDAIAVRGYAAPHLDELLLELRQDHLARRPGTRIEPTWPEGRPFALCLTHDVDFVSTKDHHRKLVRRVHRALVGQGRRLVALQHAMGSLYRLVAEPWKGDRFGGFEAWLELEARYGYRSTFHCFVLLPGPAHVQDCVYGLSDRVVFEGVRVSVAEMMRRMRSLGWEIGLHGSIASALRPGRLEQEKRRLEEVIGGEVRSCRQHGLAYDAAVTADLQAAAGFACDSTLGFNRSIGFRASTAHPFWCWSHRNGAALPLLQIPMHVMDVALLRGPAARATEAEALRASLAVMGAVQRVGVCLTLNWHAHAIAHGYLFRIFAALLQEASRRQAWGCSAGQLHDWWVARGRRLHGGS